MSSYCGAPNVEASADVDPHLLESLGESSSPAEEVDSGEPTHGGGSPHHPR